MHTIRAENAEAVCKIKSLGGKAHRRNNSQPLRNSESILSEATGFEKGRRQKLKGAGGSPLMPLEKSL